MLYVLIRVTGSVNSPCFGRRNRPVAGTQASDLTQNVMAFVQKLDDKQAGFTVPEWVPFREEIQNAGPQIASKVGELTGKLAGFFVAAASKVTRSQFSKAYRPHLTRNSVLLASESRWKTPA